MPCYLFTYHGYATWMPDHRRGYVKRKQGVLPRDTEMADRYRAKQREPAAWFGEDHQSRMIQTIKAAGPHLDAVAHAAACEPTHVHVLISWAHERTWKSMRTSVRSAMSRSLNQAFGQRSWFADSPSRKRVGDPEHFDYLVLAYLPRHGGVCWADAATREKSLRRDTQREVSVTARGRRK
ncbi:MAG: hypothetical protein AAGL98_01840 [Planctomycetota bacterium]